MALPTRVTVAFCVVLADTLAVAIYSLYAVKLEDKISASDTRFNCLRPVMGTLLQLHNNNEAAAIITKYFFIVLVLTIMVQRYE